MPRAQKTKALAKPRERQLDPRQLQFVAFYTDPRSETFGNAMASAIKAGFSEKYAATITTKGLDWVSESVGRYERMVARAEDNLDEFLTTDIEQPAIGMFGPIFEYTSKCCNEPATQQKGDDKIPFFVCSKCNQSCEVTRKQVMTRNTKVMAIKLDATQFALERLKKEKFGKPERGTQVVVPVQVNVKGIKDEYAA